MTQPIRGIKDDLNKLANRVERVDTRAAQRLRDLGEAVVGDKTQQDAWAAADAYQLIGPEVLAERVANAEVGDGAPGGLETLRNVFVLLPLVVTWLGIWLATQAYTLLLEAKPDFASQSFLYLWQTSFDHKLQPLPYIGVVPTLDKVALADFVLLGIVALLTAWVFIGNNSLNRRRDTRIMQLREALGSALADASLVLADHRRQQPFVQMKKLEEQSQRLLDEIKEERKRIGELAVQKEKEIADLRGFYQMLDRGTKQMASAADAIRASQDTLHGTVSGLSTPVSQLVTQQADLIKISQSTGRVLDQLTQHQQQSVSQLRQLVSDQKRTADELAQASKDVADVASQMRKAFQGTSDAVNHLITTQSEFLKAIAGERTAQENLAHYLTNASTNVEQALRALQESGVSISNVAVDLRDISGSLHAIRTNQDGR